MNIQYFLIIILVCTAAACKAMCDVIAHDDGFSHWGGWWSRDGWRRKYKNGDPSQGEKFPGSATVFVFITDAWHFFQFLQLWAWSISVAIALAFERLVFCAVLAFCAYFLFATVFHFSYNWLRK